MNASVLKAHRAVLFAAAVLASGAAFAQSPAKSYLYGEQNFRNACPPPLKYAAGACVRRCPAGFESLGRYCRHRSSGGRGR